MFSSKLRDVRVQSGMRASESLVGAAVSSFRQLSKYPSVIKIISSSISHLEADKSVTPSLVVAFMESLADICQHHHHHHVLRERESMRYVTRTPSQDRFGTEAEASVIVITEDESAESHTQQSSSKKEEKNYTPFAFNDGFVFRCTSTHLWFIFLLNILMAMKNS